MLNHIPVKTSVSPCAITSGYIAKSGVNLMVGESEISVLGFGYDSSEDDAKKISRAEVYERIFGYLGVGRKQYIGHSWVTNESKKFKENEVLIGGNKYLDASGLAFHSDKLEAEKHAVFELIERHYLASIWYYDLSVVEVDITEKLNENFYISYFTVEQAVPFVIAVISNQSGSIWLCGSSVKMDYKNAIVSARKEAILLLNGVLNSANNFCYSDETLMRLRSLTDTLISKARQSYFSKKIIRKIKLQEDFKVSKSTIISKIFLEQQSDFFIINLFQEKNAFVVRAVSNALLKIRKERELLKQNSSLPWDPFC